ncbi:hypothetical protein LTR28_002084, partial [Elasticomyces elasticus]
MEADWPFPDDHFDLIHLSLVHGCVADWPGMMQKIKKHLTPGGHTEHQEWALGAPYSPDGTLTPSHSFYRWGRLIEAAGLLRGRPLHLGPRLVPFLHSAHFSHVHEEVYAVPFGGWPEDERQAMIGREAMRQTVSGMEGYTTVLFTSALGWGREETEGFVEE